MKPGRKSFFAWNTTRHRGAEVCSDILVARNTPQHLERTWEVTPADIRFTDALYPVAQHAMQRGYYVPNRNSTHCSRHQCPYWRRCEQDFGGVVEV